MWSSVCIVALLLISQGHSQEKYVEVLLEEAGKIFGSLCDENDRQYQTETVASDFFEQGKADFVCCQKQVFGVPLSNLENLLDFCRTGNPFPQKLEEYGTCLGGRFEKRGDDLLASGTKINTCQAPFVGVNFNQP